jgi:glycosyltransferase involved in cell wall biosynthesis
MRIWLVTIGEPLSLDAQSRRLRTGIFAEYLVNRGHEVTWITSKFDHYSKRYFTSEDTLERNGVRFEFLNGKPYSKNISLARQINHMEIARDFERRVPLFGSPDVIVASFPPIDLCKSVARFAHANAIPFVVDIRDLWPDELLRRVPAFLSWAGGVLTAPMTHAVRRTMRRATAIIGVSQAYLEWGLAHAGRAGGVHDRVIPLGYGDSVAAHAQREARASGIIEREKVNFFFAGAFNNSVDLDAVIGALGQMPAAALSATLAGTGDKFAAWVDAARGDERIAFPGWVDPPQLAALAQNADVGLVCYKPESLVAMPNKIFEYMSFGLPILNSIPGEAAQLVESEGIGLNYTAGDATGLADCLAAMVADSQMRREMGRRSAALFEERYTADKVYGAYAALVESMAESPSAGAGAQERRTGSVRVT